MPPPARPMWICPECGRSFANRRQVHSCGEPGDLEIHFEGVEPQVRSTFDEFVAAVTDCGPVDIIAQKTRIAFHTRMSFAAVKPRRRWLDGHLVLAEPATDDRFERVTSYSKQNHVHEFRMTRPQDIDAAMRGWIAAAYEVGLQHHHQ